MAYIATADIRGSGFEVLELGGNSVADVCALELLESVMC